MRSYAVAKAVSTAAAGSQASINLDTAMDMPFVAGSKVVAAISCEEAPGTSVKIETSPDDSTWSDGAVVLAADGNGTHFIEFVLDSYIRFTVVGTTVGGLTASAYLLGN